LGEDRREPTDVTSQAIEVEARVEHVGALPALSASRSSGWL
jgi:hypothetical protein